jgi:hypothetical protein
MPPVKRITDLVDYASVLPYASEMFGIYQPLLGWKSARIQERFDQGLERDKRAVLEKLAREFTAVAEVTARDGGAVAMTVRRGGLETGKSPQFDSVVMDRVSASLPAFKDYQPAVWDDALAGAALDRLLDTDVPKFYAGAYADLLRSTARSKVSPSDAIAALRRQLERESALAGALVFLAREKRHDALVELFYGTRDRAERAAALSRVIGSDSAAEAYLSIETLNPADQEQLQRVALSPISVVHLFRQYFFELDTFLGTPERHVWLSPGSSVELVEVHTRKETVERTLENALESLTASEKTVTEQDEISDAVKDDNNQEIKFGASVTASYGSIEATSSFDYTSSQKQARESTHKRMRQQTEKLSSSLRKSFKSTFKTVSELTDLSSTKHVLANTTAGLVNYELRRKMRQVGVQVQDVGTFLCWQTYVDDPGGALGVAKLIHMGQPPDLESIPHPQEIPRLQGFTESRVVTIPFVSVDGTGADKEGEVYIDGVEEDNSEWHGEEEHIQADFQQTFACPRSAYELSSVDFDSMGKPIVATQSGPIVNTADGATFTLHLKSADFQGQDSVQVQVNLHWQPVAAANAEIDAKNKENTEKFNAAERAAYEKAFVETAKERVTIASKIASRPSEELREEERIVVYRKLIQDMLLKNVPMPDDRTRHVVAELINAMFDVDKMLYFVAPEWWRPRLHRSAQQIQPRPDRAADPAITTVGNAAMLQKRLVARAETIAQHAAPSVMASNAVGWGGIGDADRDNYYITDESDPAALGSSLGWLLQLDGDNRRNAFLNAPWVKAVIPIRPGREEAAINWLRGVEGMNGITDDVIYHSSNPAETDIDGHPLDGQKMIDVLFDLAKKIAKKHREGIETGTYPKASEVADPVLADDENTVTTTPIDRVYEHGFVPLENSFRANVDGHYEIFDQWIEIVPTDQIVPVEVTYNPRTGRLILDE